MKKLLSLLFSLAACAALAGIPYTNTPPFSSTNLPVSAGQISISVSTTAGGWSGIYTNDIPWGTTWNATYFSKGDCAILSWDNISGGWQFQNCDVDTPFFWFKADTTATNIEGTYTFSGYPDATVVLCYVNPVATAPEGINGARLGIFANAADYGASIGNATDGSSWGGAVGNGADGHGLGNVALGGDDSGANTARIPDGFTDTVEIGRGTATVDGALHFRGHALFDSNAAPLFATGGGSSNSISFTNTVTLSPGSPAYVTNWGSVAGVFQIGVPAGETGAPGTNFVTATVFTNSVLSSSQFTLYSTNALVFNGSNYIGSYSQLQSFDLFSPVVGSVGMSLGSNLVETLYVSTNNGAAWFAVSNTPCNLTNAVLVSVTGDSNSTPGSLTLYGLDHPELSGRTNSAYGQHYQFDSPTLSGDAVTLKYLQGYSPNSLASTVTLPNGFTLTSVNVTGTNHLTFTGYGNPLIDLATINNFVPINSLALTNTTNVVLKVYSTNWTASAFLETTTNLAPPILWTTVTNATSTTNSGVISLVIPRIMTAQAQFYRAHLPVAGAVTISALSFNTNAPTAPAAQGVTLGTDGTNCWVVFRNSGGGFATNKLTLSAYP